jgi:DNA-directed RNA polymerase specialized sigma24 family protein
MADTTQPTIGIADAAKQLGISVEAVRQRIRRKRLQAYKDPTGVWRIVLPAD